MKPLARFGLRQFRRGKNLPAIDTIVVAFLVALLASPAHADSISDYVRLELGIGVSRYQAQGDGTWYQQGMPHSLGLSAPVLAAGFTGPLWTAEKWGIDWHVNYVSLGHVSSDCTCTPMDENYDTKTHKKLGLYNVPDARFVGNGNAQGVALTIEPYVRYRGFRFGIEGGLFPYRPSWDVQVSNWAVGGTPTTLNIGTPHGIQLGGIVGASVSRGPFTLSYQHYFLPTKFDATHSPAIWKGADVLMVKYRF